MKINKSQGLVIIAKCFTILCISYFLSYCSHSKIKDSMLNIDNMNNAINDPMSRPIYKDEKHTISILIPMTGKFKVIGQNISDLLTLLINQINNPNLDLKIYNIDPEINTKISSILQKFHIDKHEIVIGPFLPNMLNLYNQKTSDITFISPFSNQKTSDIKKNVIYLDLKERHKVQSLIDYMKKTRRKVISLILPSSLKGFEFSQEIVNIAKKEGISVASIEFYQEGISDKQYSDAVSNIKNKMSISYFVDEYDNIIYENIKDKNKIKTEENIPEYYKKKVDTLVDTIFVSGNNEASEEIFFQLQQAKMFDRDVKYFTDAFLDPFSTKINVFNLENIFFIGRDFDYVYNLNEKFYEMYGYYPNSISYLVHDAVLIALHTLNTDEKDPRKTKYNDHGFHGILDDFFFSENGETYRKFNIYRMNRNRFEVFQTGEFFY